MNADSDILMITYNRPAYTRLSLSRLLATCDESMRVWLWHNGPHAETLGVVESFRSHPRMHQFRHSPENVGLRAPINWLWSEAEGPLLGKVDDDCLMPDGWIDALRAAHSHNPGLGALACWLFPEDDFDCEDAAWKFRDLDGGFRLLANTWVQGSGHLMKRACVQRHGLLRPREGFPRYCQRLAAKGWIHGFPFPFIRMDHMDDPRSPNTRLRSDADIVADTPLTAAQYDVRSVEEQVGQIRAQARRIQTSTLDAKQLIGIRRRAAGRLAQLGCSLGQGFRTAR